MEFPPHLGLYARVKHERLGPGVVTRHSENPLKVIISFDAGETHAYKESSWAKLSPVGNPVELLTARIPERFEQGTRCSMPSMA